MISVGVEYPALPSTVECVGVVGFILRLKAQVFSLILYNTRNHPETYEKGLREWPYFEVYSGWCNQLSNFR